MKRFIVEDTRQHETFQKNFDTLETAIKEADYQWSHLTKSEKRSVISFVVGTADVDEDGCYDSIDVIKSYNGVTVDVNLIAKELIASFKTIPMKDLEECYNHTEFFVSDKYPDLNEDELSEVCDLILSSLEDIYWEREEADSDDI
jgi:hypothetical protein